MTRVGRRRSEVLRDHQRIGKRFVPPFIATLGPIEEVSWPTEILPELLWLALLNDRHGWRRGADLARQVGLAAHRAYGPQTPRLFASTSAFYSLDGTQRRGVSAALKAAAVFGDIRDALLPLGMFYPECPLAFLAEPLPSSTDLTAMPAFKRTLASLFDSSSVEATRAQANAVYIAFTSGMLKVMKGLALANFPAIESYPNNEESKQVASAIRAAINTGLLTRTPGSAKPVADQWSMYFWKRGFELEPCSIGRGGQQ